MARTRPIPPDAEDLSTTEAEAERLLRLRSGTTAGPKLEQSRNGGNVGGKAVAGSTGLSGGSL